METREELERKLRTLTRAEWRDQLLAKGMARGMIWRRGQLPPDSPRFSSQLTNDLLNHGYNVLGSALRLRSLDRGAEILDRCFLNAAESIEAAVRNGPASGSQGFNLLVGAAAFHLGHFGARSYSLLDDDLGALNLSSCEIILASLMRRRLDELERVCFEWLNDFANTDEGIATQLEDEEVDFDPSEASYTVVCRAYHRAVSQFEFALRTGAPSFVDSAIDLLDNCIDSSEQLRHIPLWWVSILTRHLIEDIWDRSLHQRLPQGPNDGGNWLDLRRRFITQLSKRRLSEVDLWPSQLAAAERILDETDSLVVALPTSSGKTRIAELCILKCLAGSRRIVYVTPLRALSAQIEQTLSRTFQPLGFTVTSVYGASGLGASDVETVASADIVVATPEKLDFSIRQSPEVIDDVGLIVLDEGHMIGLNEREIRYEILVQRILRRGDAVSRRIVCLSAIFTDGDPFDSFTKWIRNDREGDAIRSNWRPTRQRPGTLTWQSMSARLDYTIVSEKVFVPKFVEAQVPSGRRKNAFPQDRKELLIAAVAKFHSSGHSVLVYCPQRSSVESTGEAFLKAIRQGHAKSLITEETEKEIERALSIGKEWLGESHVCMRALRAGIAIHHGQLPRPFLSAIERLLKDRVLNVAISSPTLAQGVDLAFSVLLFNSLWRAQKLIPAKEFANVIGRVGRAYVDLDGIFVLPIFEKHRTRRNRRTNEFHKLVKKARARQLESGLCLLISLCLDLLKRQLVGQPHDITEYVLNQQPEIDKMCCKETEESEHLSIALAELDAGLLALVEDLGCERTEVAALLDDALANSYWKRRLAVRDADEIAVQSAVIRGRAQHLWRRTTHTQRQGFFAASIGMEAGLSIVEQKAYLDSSLDKAQNAIVNSDADEFGTGCIELAKILFEIYPFQPASLPDDWEEIARSWLDGSSLASVTDSLGIAFIQEALIFRLVWAIEAVRVISEAADRDAIEEGETDDDIRTFVAICVTYGVPFIASARMLEAGLESRVLAVQIASSLQLEFTTRSGLLAWLDECDGNLHLDLTNEEQAVWSRFLTRILPDESNASDDLSQLSFSPRNQFNAKQGDRVRVIFEEGGHGGVLTTADFQPLADVASDTQTHRSLTGVIIDETTVLCE